jgi:hypothetical protein
MQKKLNSFTFIASSYKELTVGYPHATICHALLLWPFQGALCYRQQRSAAIQMSKSVYIWHE